MAVKIRLMRMGSKKNPFYRVVVVDSLKPRNGEYVDKIGHYNPKANPPIIEIDGEKALEWIRKGAIPTDTARVLLKKAGVFGAPGAREAETPPAEEARGAAAEEPAPEPKVAEEVPEQEPPEEAGTEAPDSGPDET